MRDRPGRLRPAREGLGMVIPSTLGDQRLQDQLWLQFAVHVVGITSSSLLGLLHHVAAPSEPCCLHRWDSVNVSSFEIVYSPLNP